MPGPEPARGPKGYPGGRATDPQRASTDGREIASHRQEAKMAPSRWFRWAGLPLLAAAVLVSPASSAFAKINQASALLMPVTMTPKSCSGAFRYAARVGNSDIVTVSPVQVF